MEGIGWFEGCDRDRGLPHYPGRSGEVAAALVSFDLPLARGERPTHFFPLSAHRISLEINPMQATGGNGLFATIRAALFATLTIVMLSGCGTAPSRPAPFAPALTAEVDDQTTAEIRRHAQEAQDAAVGITFQGSS
jgi:hypothetical protein